MLTYTLTLAEILNFEAITLKLETKLADRESEDSQQVSQHLVNIILGGKSLDNLKTNNVDQTKKHLKARKEELLRTKSVLLEEKL